MAVGVTGDVLKGLETLAFVLFFIGIVLVDANEEDDAVVDGLMRGTVGARLAANVIDVFVVGDVGDEPVAIVDVDFGFT